MSLLGLNLSSTKLNNTTPFKKFFEVSESVIIGKERELKLALTCFLAKGHLLIQDLPGMGKTTFAMLISQILGLSIGRIQFTNDLLPSDIIGTSIFNSDSKTFVFHKGPIFNEIVLGDELNRATPKTQSAFLQAMEEHRVSVDGKTHELPAPFFLIATQNPTHQTGTYPLPESQLDRFMMCLQLGYPDREAERKILTKNDFKKSLENISPLFSKNEILEFQEKSQKSHVSETLVEYVQNILAYSRQLSTIGTGLSPRAGILLLQAARAHAFVEGRDIVLPEDVQAVGPYVMSHRLADTGNKSAEILRQVPVP